MSVDGAAPRSLLGMLRTRPRPPRELSPSPSPPNTPIPLAMPPPPPATTTTPPMPLRTTITTTAGIAPAAVQPPVHRIRLVPHLDSRRTLRFEPIARDLGPGDPPLRIGRFTDRSAHSTSTTASTSNKLAFKSKVVSRAHAEIWLDPVTYKFCIRDTKSSSGTFLNHLRLSAAGTESKPYQLKDGDILQLGVDYQGGTEDIYKSVKIKVEVGREWQSAPNAFNMNAINQLRALAVASSSKKRSAKTTIPDCCICLFQITIRQALFFAPCSHAFHYKCIRPLLTAATGSSNGGEFLCPVCRAYADLEADVEVEAEESEEEVEREGEGELKAQSVIPATGLAANSTPTNSSTNPANTSTHHIPSLPSPTGATSVLVVPVIPAAPAPSTIARSTTLIPPSAVFSGNLASPLIATAVAPSPLTVNGSINSTANSTTPPSNTNVSNLLVPQAHAHPSARKHSIRQSQVNADYERERDGGAETEVEPDGVVGLGHVTSGRRGRRMPDHGDEYEDEEGEDREVEEEEHLPEEGGEQEDDYAHPELYADDASGSASASASASADGQREARTAMMDVDGEEAGEMELESYGHSPSPRDSHGHKERSRGRNISGAQPGDAEDIAGGEDCDGEVGSGAGMDIEMELGVDLDMEGAGIGGKRKR